jgi:hypothetical protein
VRHGGARYGELRSGMMRIGACMAWIFLAHQIFSCIIKPYTLTAHEGGKMSGQRIDDHAFWAGGRSKGSIFPEGAKTKEVSEREGAGAVMRYEDTEEAIGHVQKESVKHLKSKPLKPGYRY